MALSHDFPFFLVRRSDVLNLAPLIARSIPQLGGVRANEHRFTCRPRLQHERHGALESRLCGRDPEPTTAPGRRIGDAECEIALAMIEIRQDDGHGTMSGPWRPEVAASTSGSTTSPLLVLARTNVTNPCAVERIAKATRQTYFWQFERWVREIADSRQIFGLILKSAMD